MKERLTPAPMPHGSTIDTESILSMVRPLTRLLAPMWSLARRILRVAPTTSLCRTQAMAYSLEEKGSLYSTDYRLYFSMLAGSDISLSSTCALFREWRSVHIPLPRHPTVCRRLKLCVQHAGRDTTLDKCKNGGRYTKTSSRQFSVCVCRSKSLSH